MFIVFEGIDGSGTTTQAEKLAQNLNNFGQKTILTGEPTENIIGKFVREFLRQKKITSPMALQYLFCADRTDHIFNTIEPEIKKNNFVVSHRYFWSTIAFGMLNCKENDLKQICKYFIKPDIIFYLDINPGHAIRRIESRGNKKELFEKEQILNKVVENFKKLIRENNDKTNIFILDAEKSIEEIANEALNITKKFINKND